MSSSHSRPPTRSSESWCQHWTPLGIVADQSQHLLHMRDHADQLLRGAGGERAAGGGGGEYWHSPLRRGEESALTPEGRGHSCRQFPYSSCWRCGAMLSLTQSWSQVISLVSFHAASPKLWASFFQPMWGPDVCGQRELLGFFY